MAKRTTPRKSTTKARAVKNDSQEIKGDSLVKRAIENKRREDGWSNVITGLGTKAKDARLAQEVSWFRMTEHDIEHLYAGDSMASKIVDLPVDDALDGGFEWEGISKASAKKLNARLKELHFLKKIDEGCKKGRQYGGAAILKVYQDDLKLDTPPEEMEKLKPIKSLIVFHRFELFAMYEDVDKDILSPTFGQPIYYTFTGKGNTKQTNLKIHHKRLEKFHGNKLPETLYQSNNYWHDSVLSKPYEALRNYSFAHDGVNAALKDLSTAVFKIKNLADQLAADCDDKVIKRIDLVNVTKSIARAVVLDSEGEDFDYKVRNLTGAGDLVDRAESRLAAEVSIPKTILLGTSPKGSLGGGTSGDHELENWYNYIESFQKKNLDEPMLQIAKEVCVELGINHDNLSIKWKPLWQMSENEEATLRKTQADTDNIYYNMGALDPSEIRNSRFGGKDGYSTETELDKSIDVIENNKENEALKAEIERLTKEKMGQNPNDPETEEEDEDINPEDE